MFTCQRKVFLNEVDATGAIYFTSLFRYAQELFELFLYENKKSLRDFFSQGYLFPIVHAKADYTSFLGLSQEMFLTLSIERISERSLTLVTEVQNVSTGSIAGTVTLIHAFLLKGEKKGCKIPEDILSFLKPFMKSVK